MFHFSIRAFGHSFTLQRDYTPGDGLGLFWSCREPSGAVRYHCGAWVLWVEGLTVPPIRVPGEGADVALAARIAHAGPRFELACGGCALSF